MKKLIFSLLLLLSKNIYAGDTFFWNRDRLFFNPSDNTNANLELGTRQDLTLKEKYKNYFKGTLLYNFYEDIKIGGGLAYYDRNAALNGIVAGNEKRVFQQVSLQHLLDDWKLNQLYTFEERFFDDPGKTFIFRMRYKLKVTLPWQGPWKAQWMIYDEVFFNGYVSDSALIRGFNENRLFAGARMPVFDKLFMQLGYMSWYITGRQIPNQNNVVNLNFDYYW